MSQRIRFAAVTALLAALSPLARTQALCYTENDGPNFNDAVSMGGPNLLLGVRFVAPSNLNVSAIEVFTGEQTGTNTVSLWSDDAGPMTPLAQLTGMGSWSMDTANSWQGAALPTPFTLIDGTTYWMVWGSQNGSQSSLDVPMVPLGQQYSGSFDGGSSWSGPFQFADRHWKFRLYCGNVALALCFGDGVATPCPCGNHDAGGGAGCANSTGSGCTLSATGSDSIAAGDLVLHAANALPNQPGVFFQGDMLLNGGAGIPFGDGLRCTGTNVRRLEVVVPDPSGNASSTVNIAAIGGVTVGDRRYYQFWYRDPNGGPCGSGFNLSNALNVLWST